MSNKVEYEEDEYFSKTKILIKYAKESDENRKHLTNLIIIDLVTSMEVFMERSLRQFIDKFNKIELTTCKISDKLKIEQSNKLINEIQKIQDNPTKDNKIKEKLELLRNLWNPGNKYKLDFETKFKQGKHGENQVENLFKKIGIQNIFKLIKIESKDQSLIENITYIDIQSFIRDITEKRNIAIHEGAPLSDNITIENLEYYKDTTSKIMNNVVQCLNNELDLHQNKT